MAPSRWRTAIVALTSLGVVAGLSLIGCTGSPAAPAASPITVYDPERRAAAPELVGKLLGGGDYRLADHRGEVVVLNFWASWCPPCRAEADDLERAYQATKADQVSFLGVNVRDQPDQATSAQDNSGATYPSLFDPASAVALLFDVPPATIPATIIIDREGRIAAVARGALLDSVLTPVIAQVSRG